VPLLVVGVVREDTAQVATMHSLGPALDQSPDLFLVIGHIQLTPFDGTTPGAFRSAYRVGLLYVSKLIGGRQSFRLVPRVSLPREAVA